MNVCAGADRAVTKGSGRPLRAAGKGGESHEEAWV